MVVTDSCIKKGSLSSLCSSLAVLVGCFQGLVGDGEETSCNDCRSHIQVDDQGRRRTITNFAPPYYEIKEWGRLRPRNSRKDCQKARKGQSPEQKTATATATHCGGGIFFLSFRFSMDLPPQNWCGVPLPKVCKVHSKSWSQNEDRNGSRARRPRRALSLYRISNSNRQRLSSPKDDHSNRIYCYTRWETMELQLLRLW